MGVGGGVCEGKGEEDTITFFCKQLLTFFSLHLSFFLPFLFDPFNMLLRAGGGERGLID